MDGGAQEIAEADRIDGHGLKPIADDPQGFARDACGQCFERRDGVAAGAGFHEELTFRVVLLSGGALLLRQALGAPPARAWLLCALVSSLLFALAHHVGPQGEGLTLTALCFRTLAGVFLALLYGARGFAVAVYTHAFYDLLVFFVLG